jgi:thiazole synthase
MAEAFRLSVESGRIAFEAQLAGKISMAASSSPLTSFLM